MRGRAPGQDRSPALTRPPIVAPGPSNRSRWSRQVLMRYGWRMFRARILAVLPLSACAAQAGASVNTGAPRVDKPEIAPSAAGAMTAPESPTAERADVADRYTFDVRVVSSPPSFVFLLARFSEEPGDSCAARLLAHARGLGANRLYIDRSAPCAGGAFFVRPTPLSRDQDGPPGVDGLRGQSWLVDWVRDRWRRPSSISPEESRRLCVVVQFTVSPLRRVWKVNGQPIRSSGNHEFDESVRATLEAAIDEHATVPAPPRDVVGEHVDYRIEFTEGDPRICRRAPP
jgi:TonB-like protein